MKQKLYKTRNECQSVLSEERLRLDGADRLAELEKQILEYFLSKGFKLKKDQKEDDTKWFLEVQIKSIHKKKTLDVIFYYWSYTDGLSQWKESNRDRFVAKTTKEMFDKAFEYFKVEEK
jgi:hypothetical protein